MDRCQWTMDNYWKLGFHQKIKKGRKMRKENENKIIDNQPILRVYCFIVN